MNLFAIGIALAIQGSGAPLLDDYERVAVGSFSSAEQARADPRYAIVHADVVRIWPERTDGLWIYQEQTIIDAEAGPDAPAPVPYFQRVGHVRLLPDGRLHRDNYVLADARRFAGFPRKAGVLAPTAEDLGPAGCHNIIDRVAPGHFIARTEECSNTHRGASHMIGLAIKAPDWSINWDRGFSADGHQVWGPEEGGYVFRRVEDPPGSVAR